MNIVEEKAKKQKKSATKMDPAEERAMKELEKVAAFQARMSKKNNRQKKIRQLTEENLNYNGGQKGKIKVLSITN